MNIAFTCLALAALTLAPPIAQPIAQRFAQPIATAIAAPHAAPRDDGPPAWLREHMAAMVRDGGTWHTDNAKWTSAAEPAKTYATSWSWGIGKMSIQGRLFGLDAGGAEFATYWEFRLYWDP